MDSYAEFWNSVFYGNGSGFPGPDSLEEYWARLLILVSVCFVAGIATVRWGLVASLVTVVLVGVYVAAVVPFMVWTASCTGCGAAFSYDTARSFELMIINAYWGGLLGMGLAALWLGVWVSRVRSYLRWR
jgi:hypothetical protein